MKKYFKYVPAIAINLVFIVWTILVKTIDVRYIYRVGYIGFSNFNFQVNDFVTQFARTELFDKLSDVGLYLSFAVVLAFGVIGIVQWVKRKSIKKVDRLLFVLLGIYVLTVAEFLVFEIAKINYSPLSTPDELKASYPSTHILCFMTFVLTGAIALFEYLEVNKCIKWASIGVVIAISMMFALLRLFSGQHYFSDVVGGLLLSASNIALFIALLMPNNEVKEEVE